VCWHDSVFGRSKLSSPFDCSKYFADDSDSALYESEYSFDEDVLIISNFMIIMMFGPTVGQGMIKF